MFTETIILGVVILGKMILLPKMNFLQILRVGYMVRLQGIIAVIGLIHRIGSGNGILELANGRRYTEKAGRIAIQIIMDMTGQRTISTIMVSR